MEVFFSGAGQMRVHILREDRFNNEGRNGLQNQRDNRRFKGRIGGDFGSRNVGADGTRARLFRTGQRGHIQRTGRMRGSAGV